MRKSGTIVLLALAILPLLLPAQDTFESVRFRAVMSSSHEPPGLIGVEAMGNGIVEFILRRSSTGDIQSAVVDFRVQYHFGEAETLVAMHIHRGEEGVNGPVVVPSDFGTQVAANMGSGALFRQHEATDPTQIATIMAIMANPGGYYLNLHSSSHPPGLIRGQLLPEDPSGGAIQALETKVDDKTDALAEMIRQLAAVLGLRLP